MSVGALMNQACTITTRTDSATVDRYGNPTESESTATTTCHAEQRSRTETSGESVVQVEEWLVMLPAGTTIDAHDKITVGTLALEVLGPPWPVRNPRTQTTSHVEVTCKRAA